VLIGYVAISRAYEEYMILILVGAFDFEFLNGKFPNAKSWIASSSLTSSAANQNSKCKIIPSPSR
jgi:hypothetical protein